MLKRVEMRNFKSFVTGEIDLTATKYAMLEKTNTVDGILKGLTVVGANASGKSNTIHSISILLDLLLGNAMVDLSFHMCLFTGDNLELTYYFEFDGKEICYSLIFNRDETVAKEILKVDENILLSRIGLEADCLLTENRFYHSDSIDPKTLFLRNVYFNTKFAKFPMLKKWFDFMKNSIYIDFANKVSIAYDRNLVISLTSEITDDRINEINSFLKDTKIGQEIDYKNQVQISPYANLNIDNNKKEFFIKRDCCDYWMPIFLESHGNKALLNFLPALIHIINNDGMLVLDEFNCSSFHNELEELIIKYVFEHSVRSQLIIATHSSNVLKTSLYRPDQIYSVDFIGNNGSVLKRFSSESPRQSQNLEKMYLAGVFDGIPNYKNKR